MNILLRVTGHLTTSFFAGVLAGYAFPPIDTFNLIACFGTAGMLSVASWYLFDIGEL